MTLTRRKFVSLAAVAAVDLPITRRASPAVQSRYAAAFGAIDRMAERYLREMNAPGMTLAIADRGSVLRVTTYGFSDADRRELVAPDHLFHIGSITKSFAGAALLQLRDEGKVDLHAPVARYLPWLRIEPREGVTIHHLLTHSSGLPGGAPLFLPDRDGHHVAGYTPGSHFHYCNMGYQLLGLLLETIDGKPYPEVMQQRLFKPLGMTASVAYIAPELRARTANSSMAYLDDRPYPRRGRLAAAPQLVFDGAAGSISSTAADMGRYVSMIASRGKGVLLPASFDDFVKRYIPTSDGGEESYGYGLFMTKVDGHEVARHTGGMVSFMSAMHVDLEDGVGAFASINAQQGYRPNPVTMFALRAIRAVNGGQPLPEIPVVIAPERIVEAADLAGVYSGEGGSVEFVAEGEGLVLVRGNRRLLVETSPSGYIVQHPDFDRFAFLFERPDKDGPAVAVGHGARWWASDRYRGERKFEVPAAWSAFTGHYRNDSPWSGSVRIVSRQGKLWLDGLVPLRPVDAVTFRLADTDFNPEWVQFLDVVNGKARRIRFSGDDFKRVDVA